MEIVYSVEVSRCHFTIKCIPGNTARQQIENIKIQLSPKTPYCEGRDGFHNLQIYGIDELPHTVFRFEIEGDARCGMAAYEEAADENLAMVFRHPHGLNVAGQTIQAYYENWKAASCGSVYERAIGLMHRLHQDFAYEPCTTTVETTAEEAFAQGHGVCQDYAHIFIALLHLSGIAARYVTGLIVGEGASHAWVEILQDGKWYGLDPTNDSPVSENHIKIGVGRDAKDCMINRGIMHGGGLHTQTVKVSVTEQ